MVCLIYILDIFQELINEGIVEIVGANLEHKPYLENQSSKVRSSLHKIFHNCGLCAHDILA